MDIYRRYSLFIGLFLFVCVVILLLSSPGSFLTKRVSFITDELYHSSGSDVDIKTKIHFSDVEQMQSFPEQLGDWDGYDYRATEVEKTLGADLLLLRGYYRPGLYQPLFLTILQAATESSFHSPQMCFEGVGYKIAEDGKDTIPIPDPVWAEVNTSIEIPVNILSVYKERNGEVAERRIVMYFYVKDNRLLSDIVTMVEVQALAPLDGPYDGILDEVKTFTAEAIPYMFEPADTRNSTLLERMLGRGVLGYAAVIILVFIPIAIAVYPYLKLRDLLDKLLAK